MIVYVITQGCYSDYHVCGVAIDRQAANRLRELYSGQFDDANIEEYDTEKPLSVSERLDKGYTAYKVDIMDGVIVNVRILDKDDISYSVGYLSASPKFKTYPRFATMNKGWVYCLAKDEEHAKKIALDTYAQWKAEKEGIV